MRDVLTLLLDAAGRGAQVNAMKQVVDARRQALYDGLVAAFDWIMQVVGTEQVYAILHAKETVL